jgi:hypothetical protein
MDLGDDEDDDEQSEAIVPRAAQKGKARKSLLDQQDSALVWAAENLACKSAKNKAAIKVYILPLSYWLNCVHVVGDILCLTFVSYPNNYALF